ncbi:MAG: hypothetical protein RMZ41_021315 [Nostoc sp. DedVER02]|nr:MULTISPECIES: hypothetical protein [unclassified Nostoc]MDZ7986498.1 hypothetical protein [Nostoc sp. DedVER02]MDZ8112454.1 hypothetical protein [Nostoc sp. DedVER01b]
MSLKIAPLLNSKKLQLLGCAIPCFLGTFLIYINLPKVVMGDRSSP